MEEKFLERLQLAVVLAVILLVSVLWVRARLEPAPSSSFYFIAKEALAKKLPAEKISSLTGPRELRLEKVNDRSTNVIGWVISINKTGQISTQWFRCKVVESGSLSAKADNIDLFASEPRETQGR